MRAFLATAQCAAGENCQDRFAISVANIVRDAAPPAPGAKRAPAPRTAPQKTPDAEREYLKRLNQDLDKMLGK